MSMRRITSHGAGLTLFLAAFFTACKSEAPTGTKERAATQPSTRPAPVPSVPATPPAGPAAAAIVAKSGSTVAGKATFTPTETGVRVRLEVEGAPPGKHGAHIHEKDDCSAPDAASAGGHFNPEGHDHALPAGGPRHLGDLGNIEIGADGKGTLEIGVEGANLRAGDATSFLGRAVILHEKEDDGGQPTGNAGGRIGCGEIKG